MPKPKPSAPSPSRAVIYARYSSHAQNDASIEQQVAECREYAAAHELEVVDTYADRALSGRTDRRPEFQKMIRHAEAGRFGTILTYKSNRISRSMLDALRYEARLAHAGVKVIYCREDFGDNAAGRMALHMMMTLNEFYSENMGEDIRRGLIDSARQGRVVGAIPYGYRRGEDGRFAIDEQAAAVVREIYRRVSEGESLASVADDLNRRRIPTGYGHTWGKNSFSKLICNERYTGVYLFAGVRIEDGMPVIIDRGLFDRVQEKLRRRKEVAGRRRDNAEYLLTGKVWCGKCGAPMVGISGISKSGAPYRYYVCRTRRESHTCDKLNVRKDTLEREIARSLLTIVLRPDVIDWMIDNVLRYQEEVRKNSDLASYRDRLVEVKRSLSNLVKAIEAGIFSDSTKARLDELEAEQHELQGMIAMEEAKIRPFTADQIRFFLESFRGGDINDPAFLKNLFRTFLTKVYLYDDKYRIVFNYSDAGGPDDFESPLTPEDLDSAEASAECSYSGSSEPPQQAETNTSWLILMIKGVFVLTVFGNIR